MFVLHTQYFLVAVGDRTIHSNITSNAIDEVQKNVNDIVLINVNLG